MSRYRADHHADESQLAVIHAREQAIRLVAPAGSGKTETLVRRVIERTGKEGIDPRKVLMLTFDNNGKQAFSRLLKTFAPRQRLPEFVTFNKFGNDILKRYAPDEIAARTISDQELGPIRRALGPLPILSWDEARRDPIATFRDLKESGYRPVEADRDRAIRWLRYRYLMLPGDGTTLDLSGTGHDQNAAPGFDARTERQLEGVFDAFLQYEHELRARDRMDFQDQKLRPLQRLLGDEQRRDHLRGQYAEIIVDEAQDISRLDALLLWTAIGPDTTITLAGDDDQTIYEFRQASSVFLREAPRHFEREFTTYHLSMTYRSPDAILQPAQRLIAHNTERLEKGVSSARLEPGEVIVHAAANPADRIARLVKTVRTLHDERGIDWMDIGILVPEGRQQTPIQTALQRAQIPVVINTGKADPNRPAEDAVELSTIHRAKGRQWRAVFLPMSGEGEMPDAHSIRSGHLEADRRALYVSMSRAADVLAVSYVRRGEADTIERSLSGEVTGTSGASRFLFEAGLVHEAADTEDRAIPAGDLDIIQDAAASPSAAVQPEATSPAPDRTPEPPPAPTRQSVADRLRQRDASSLRKLGRTGDAPEVSADPDTADSPERPAVVDAEADPGTAKPSRAERAERAEQRRAEDAARSQRPIPEHILTLVDAAERKLGEQDHRYALFDGWEAVYSTLRLLEPGIWAEKGDAFELINALSDHQTLPDQWINRLHTWRKVRNDGIKQSNYRPTGITDLVTGLRPFMAIAAAALGDEEPPSPPHQASPAATTAITPKPIPAPVAVAVTIAGTAANAPAKEIYPVPTTEAYGIARILANGGFDPARGKTIRTIGIHTLNHGVEFLPLQLGMILLDVKFFVPGTFRFSASPLFARYCDRQADVRLPAEMRGLVRQPSAVSPEVETRIHELLDEMLATVVAQEGYRGKPGALLDKRLRDAMRLANGEVNRGVRLEPLDAANGPAWGRG
ncbi:MAG: UvrD-helicase domain-containing protein [Thermomicrobiales bacterium]